MNGLLLFYLFVCTSGQQVHLGAFHQAGQGLYRTVVLVLVDVHKGDKGSCSLGAMLWGLSMCPEGYNIPLCFFAQLILAYHHHELWVPNCIACCTVLQ